MSKYCTPIASATQLLNREHILYCVYQGIAEKQLSIVDAVEKSQQQKKMQYLDNDNYCYGANFIIFPVLDRLPLPITRWD